MANIPQHHATAATSSLALSLILCITGSLLAFDQFYVLTHGGPDNTTSRWCS